MPRKSIMLTISINIWIIGKKLESYTVVTNLEIKQGYLRRSNISRHWDFFF